MSRLERTNVYNAPSSAGHSTIGLNLFGKSKLRWQEFCQEYLSNLVASAVTLIPGKVLTVLCTFRFSNSVLIQLCKEELPVGEFQWVLRRGVDYVLQTSV